MVNSEQPGKLLVNTVEAWHGDRVDLDGRKIAWDKTGTYFWDVLGKMCTAENSTIILIHIYIIEITMDYTYFEK